MKVAGYDFEENNNYIWLCALDKNALCMIDKHTMEGKVIGSFPHKDICASKLSWSMVELNNQIVFCPFAADHIAVYKIEQKIVEFYTIIEPKIKRRIKFRKDEKFIDIIPYRHYCFLLGRTFPGIIRFDTESGEMIVLDAFMDCIDSEQEHFFEAYFSKGYAQVGKEVYLGLTCCNALLKFNLDNFEYSLIKIDCGFSGFGGLCSGGDNIWVTDFNNNGDSFLRYNIKTGETAKINLPITDRLLSPLLMNDYLFFFPFTNKRRIICYDTSIGRWELYEEFNSTLSESVGRVVSAKVVQDSILGSFGNAKEWFKLQNGKFSLLRCSVCADELLNVIENDTRIYLTEDTDINLVKFVNYIVSD